MVCGFVVERCKIPEYFTDEYYVALRIYNNYCRFGLPYAGGTAEQPAHIMDVIEGMTIADERIAAARTAAEKRKQNGNNSRRT